MIRFKLYQFLPILAAGLIAGPTLAIAGPSPQAVRAVTNAKAKAKAEPQPSRTSASASSRAMGPATVTLPQPSRPEPIQAALPNPSGDPRRPSPKNDAPRAPPEIDHENELNGHLDLGDW